MVKHCDQKQVWNDWLFWLSLLYSPFLKEIRGRTQNRTETWKQELKQEPCRTVSYWLAHQDLLSVLSHVPQDHQPRDGTTHNGLGPSPWTTNALELHFMEASLQLRLLSHRHLQPTSSWHTKPASNTLILQHIQKSAKMDWKCKHRTAAVCLRGTLWPWSCQ